MCPVGVVEDHEAISALGDGVGERAEHGDLLGARRAQVLLEHRERGRLEAGAGGREHVGAVGRGDGSGIDPGDLQAVDVLVGVATANAHLATLSISRGRLGPGLPLVARRGASAGRDALSSVQRAGAGAFRAMHGRASSSLAGRRRPVGTTAPSPMRSSRTVRRDCWLGRAAGAEYPGRWVLASLRTSTGRQRRSRAPAGGRHLRRA